MKKFPVSMRLLFVLAVFLIASNANAYLYDYEGELTIRDQDLDLRVGHFLDGYELQPFTGQFDSESGTLSLFTFSISNNTSTYTFSHSEDVLFDSSNRWYRLPVENDPYAAFMLKEQSSTYSLSIYDRSDTDSPFWETTWTSSRFLDNFSYELAPVPIPGAVWLLASGLVGLVGLRRRFQN